MKKLSNSRRKYLQIICLIRVLICRIYKEVLKLNRKTTQFRNGQRMAKEMINKIKRQLGECEKYLQMLYPTKS